MIDLRPNCVAQFLMNDDAANPWVVGLNGVPTELVKNGTFEDNSEWTWGDGWAHHAPTKQAEHSNGYPYTLLSQNIGAIQGKTYLVIWELTFHTSGEARMVVGGDLGTSQSVPGWYINVLTAVNSSGLLQAYAQTDGTFRIDNISCFCLDDYPLTGVFSDAVGNPFTNAHSVAGKINTALEFDGNDDYIEVEDEGALEFPNDTDDFSIAIWFKPASLGVTDHLLDKRDAANDGWQLYIYSDNRIVFQLAGASGGAYVIADAADMTTTDWHLIVVVIDRDGNGQIYIDNVASGAAVNVSGKPMSIVKPLHIGESYVGDSRFTGKLDVTTFFDKALSQAERDFIWQNGRGTNALHEVLRAGFTSIESKPRMEALLSSTSRMYATVESKPRMEAEIISP